jgi:phospholipase/lecithinase/hemolysin
MPGFSAVFLNPKLFILLPMAFKAIRLFCFLLFALRVPAAENPGLVAFGDSLSDMGNRWLATNKPDIKFRQTWVAQLTGPDMLNLPGLKPSGLTSWYGGSNYAVGGAGTAHTASLTPARNKDQHLTQQVSERYLNPAFNKDGVHKEALHVIVIGANDLMLASIGPAQVLSQWKDLDQEGIAVARSAEGQIQALASAGVTRVMWGNIFNVALAPALNLRARALGESMAPVYQAALTKAVVAHNAEMDAAVTRLTQTNPALQVIKLDLFARFAEVAADPPKFGFKDVTTGANDRHHVFSADGLHPTPQGQQMLAEFAWQVLQKAGIGPKD